MEQNTKCIRSPNGFIIKSSGNSYKEDEDDEAFSSYNSVSEKSCNKGVYMSKKFILLVVCIVTATLLSTLRSTSAETNATFVVDSTIDAIDENVGDGVCATVENSCTLRAAIQEANTTENATIQLPAGIFLLTQTGASEDASQTGDLDIQATMIIQGNGQAETIIDGLEADRVFHVLNGTVTIQDLTIQNGDSSVVDESGGGVYNAASLTMSNVIVQNNFAESSGGGVFNVGKLVMTDSLIQQNVSYYGNGDALSNPEYGIAEISNTSFLSNSEFDNGFDRSVIFNRFKMNLNNVSMENNKSTWVIYNYHELRLLDSQLSHNEGEIIVSSPFFSSTLVKNTTISHNESVGDFLGNVEIQSSYILSNTSGIRNRQNLKISDTEIAYNCLAINNDGNVSIQRTAIHHNNCGGIYGFNGSLTVTNSTISHNGTGGGLVYEGVPEHIQLANVTIAHNQSDHSAGGLHLNLEPDRDVLIGNSIIANNVSTGDYEGDCFTKHPYELFAPTLVGSATNDCLLTGTLLQGDPLLDALQDNGGMTPTHALLPNSPAIDAGASDGCSDGLGNSLNFDQRNNWRKLDGNDDGVWVCDLGAFEYGTIEVEPFAYLPVIIRD